MRLLDRPAGRKALANQLGTNPDARLLEPARLCPGKLILMLRYHQGAAVAAGVACWRVGSSSSGAVGVSVGVAVSVGVGGSVGRGVLLGRGVFVGRGVSVGRGVGVIVGSGVGVAGATVTGDGVDGGVVSVGVGAGAAGPKGTQATRKSSKIGRSSGRANLCEQRMPLLYHSPFKPAHNSRVRSVMSTCPLILDTHAPCIIACSPPHRRSDAARYARRG